MDFFRKEVTCDDAQRRVDAMRRVRYIAHALGEENTVHRLLPLLEGLLYLISLICIELIKTSDDEVLYVLAKEYVSLAKHIGRESNRTLLILPLTLLANRDESVVRERAVESLKQLVETVHNPTVKVDLVRHYLLPSIESLGVSAWFPPRFSVCSLFAVAYPLADEDQRTCLHSLFVKLSNDETPMVKRAAAAAMTNFLPTVFINQKMIPAELFDTLRRATTDGTQDTLRVMGAQTSVRLAVVLPADQTKQHVMPLLTCACEDSSWRVRIEVARSLGMLTALGSDALQTFVLPLAAQLLTDPEADIRREALESILSTPAPSTSADSNNNSASNANNNSINTNIGNASSENSSQPTSTGTSPSLILQPSPFLTPSMISTFLLPHLDNLGRDFDLNVRVSFAKVCKVLVKLMDKDVLQSSLIPIWLDLLKDEDQNTRLFTIYSAPQILQALGIENTSFNILNEMLNLASDSQWRVRLALVESLPSLAKTFGTDVFVQKLQNIHTTMLQDPVRQVRIAAVGVIVPIVETMNWMWANQILSPLVAESSSATSYFQRVLALRICLALVEVLPADRCIDVVLPCLKKLLTDKVVNVRIVACQVLKDVVELTVSLKQSTDHRKTGCMGDGLSISVTKDVLLPIVSQAAEKDADDDVRYFASLCVNTLKSI